MADLILKVTPEEVHTKAQQIQSKRSELNTLMTDMKSIVDNITESWNSDSGRAYQEQYTNVTRNINNSLEVLATHVRNLEDAASKYADIEESQGTAAKALSTENIF